MYIELQTNLPICNSEKLEYHVILHVKFSKESIRKSLFLNLIRSVPLIFLDKNRIIMKENRFCQKIDETLA